MDEFSVTTDYTQGGELQVYLATVLGTWTGCYAMEE